MPNDDSVAAEARRARMQARLSLTALARKFDELAGVLLHDAGELGRIWRRGLFFCGARCCARPARLFLPTV